MYISIFKFVVTKRNLVVVQPDLQSYRVCLIQRSSSSFASGAEGLGIDENLQPLPVLTTVVMSARHIER